MGCGASAAYAHPGSSVLNDSKTSLSVQAELIAAGWLQRPDSPAVASDAKPQDSLSPEKDGEGPWMVPDRACTGSISVKTNGSVLDCSTAYERALVFCSRVPLFKLIPRGDLPLIVKAMQISEYKVWQAVIEQGEVTDKLFVILAGQVEVVMRTELDDGTKREERLATLSSGDYFGEPGLLLAEEARASVCAIGKERLLTYSISHDAFFHLELHERLHIPKRHAMVGIKAKQIAQGGRPQPVPKAASDITFLMDALRVNKYLPSVCEITEEVLEQLAQAAARCTASRGEVLFKQGDLHVCRLCVVEVGGFDCEADGHMDAVADLAGSCGLAFGTERRAQAGSWHETKHKKGDIFGELELLLSQPAAATVTAVEDSVYWGISRDDFTDIFAQQLETRLSRHVQALRGVGRFSGLYNEELRALAKGAIEVSYPKGDEVVSEGDVSDACYVLIHGEAVQMRAGIETGKRYAACSEQGIANFFGEKDLLNPGPRTASVRITSESAQVLSIDRTTFEIILQPLATTGIVGEIPSRTGPTEPTSEEQQLVKNVKIMRSRTFTDLTLTAKAKREDLNFIGNLGTGQFGYVDLVEEKATGRRFALKRMHRKHFADPEHRRQVKLEKSILSMTHCPFLVQLYATYKEPQSLAFLLELVTGGDLRLALCRDNIRGNEDCARFYCAGVVLGLEHLHQRHIVHRDLKPENILLDEKGWPKVTDFGLSKFCVGKTYTVSGTPNYMAPESFQAGGHGLAVDWWSLGCLTYELMAGKTPFASASGAFVELFENIAKGVQDPDQKQKRDRWPKTFGAPLRRFLFCLLQTNAASRLPMRCHGIAQVQAHPWYELFQWPAFKDRSLQAPVIPPSLGSLKPCIEFDDQGDDATQGFDWADDDDL